MTQDPNPNLNPKCIHISNPVKYILISNPYLINPKVYLKSQINILCFFYLFLIHLYIRTQLTPKTEIIKVHVDSQQGPKSTERTTRTTRATFIDTNRKGSSLYRVIYEASLSRPEFLSPVSDLLGFLIVF